MNKSNIEWTQFTSNPIRGKCRHACPYCYAERIRVRFKQPAGVSWHPEELENIEQRKKPATIFMGSMHDIFGHWIPNEWIKRILQSAISSPQHTFIFLTKNPKRFSGWVFPDNCWCGYTDDGTRDYRNWIYLRYLPNTFVSLEPLIGNTVNLNMSLINALIIGAMTGPAAIKPDRKLVEKIIEKAGDRPVFLKNNLLSLFPDMDRRQDVAWLK